MSVPKPLLMQALRGGNAEKVRAVLEADPEAAKLPFFDHLIEPPLCCAVREGRSPEILRLLLDFQASVNMGDVHGQTPLALLCSISSSGKSVEDPTEQPSEEWAIHLCPPLELKDFAKVPLPSHFGGEENLVQTASLLLAAGADEHQPDLNDLTAAKYAAKSTSRQLSTLVKYYRQAQACHTLLRASKLPTEERPLRILTPGLARLVCSFLVPKRIEEKLA